MYRLKYLPSALLDILEIEDYLFELDPDVSEKFTDAIKAHTSTLAEHPYMCQVFEDNIYFRSMPLPYNYRMFYHIDEVLKVIKVHRVLHSARNLERLL